MSEAKKQIKVAGYIRVSTEEQAQQGYSLEAQTRIIEKVCLEKGWAMYMYPPMKDSQPSPFPNSPGRAPRDLLEDAKSKKVQFEL